MTHMKAELREKKIGKKTVYLKFWVPEIDEVKEISVARNKVDDAGNLTENGKQAVKQHLEEMVHEPEKSSIPENEKEIGFEP